MSKFTIQKCTFEHLKEYGRIYAAAFSGEPWKDPWKAENAEIHVKEWLESKHFYGLEYSADDKVIGFILGTAVLFAEGRTFMMQALAVDPEYQRQGIAKKLVTQCLADVKAMGMINSYLITANNDILPKFYSQFGFKPDEKICMLGLKF
ncbi:MAG: GNAT family N-acetyltransferase [Selenomonadaceae bacterium]|nr:GNAT family N-acetyltransferase [Selenomonadaceae bacterium]